jgi:hypothetical protein
MAQFHLHLKQELLVAIPKYVTNYIDEMSFSRLNHDDCTYEHNLRQSIGVGDYMLKTPAVDCQPCLNTYLPTGSTSSTCDQRVDIDSELRGITRRATNCPTRKFIPGTYEPNCTIKHLPDCRTLPNEDTRISNPPCTLRGTGWNRWEWLCKDPQENILVPFDYNINYRMIVKDNHRPCIATPLNPLPVLPPGHCEVTEKQTGGMVPSCGAEMMDIPSVHWRSCKTYAPYV